MRNRIFLLMLLALPHSTRGQGPINYEVTYAAPGNNRVHISLDFPEAISAPVSLVMPRGYPGGYGQVSYDSFVEQVRAFSPDGKALEVERETEGPRWTIGEREARVARVEYDVDLARMESQLDSAVETSKVRRGYVGLLGYSVFAYIDGLEERKIKLRVNAPKDWPALTTLAPQVPASAATATGEATNYYALADSEVLMGPDLQLRRIEGKIPLILAVYAESNEDVGLEGQIARQALDRVQAYFGDTPFRQYTVQLELLRPIAGHEYDFSQEHIDSGTFSLSADRALSAQSSRQAREAALFNYAHHMAHCWIPKRAYGEGYLPFTWEMTPVIDTIWFNEGFARYAAIEALAAGLPQADGSAFRQRQLAGLRRIVDDAPLFMRRMSLEVLSREASFLYATDFRTGANIFARGALMAAEMDQRIRAETGEKKSLRDALQALVAWSEKNHRAFRLEEMTEIFRTATGVDTREILNRWRKPLSN
jgi:predicted metalloprotease with PDZ domain